MLKKDLKLTKLYCGGCGKYFIYSSGLSRHIKDKH